MKLKTAPPFIAAACLAIVSGCMNDDYAGTTYSRDHARQGHTIYTATIQSIQNVTIQGTEGVLGGIGGAVLGGVIGHSIGGGSGKALQPRQVAETGIMLPHHGGGKPQPRRRLVDAAIAGDGDRHLAHHSTSRSAPTRWMSSIVLPLG